MLSALDWAILALFMAASLGVGAALTRRAGSSTSEFFLSGRSMPWWLVGTSMVATSFSVDTPLYITALIRTKGIYENWQWWCFLLNGLMSVFFFARLWRRSGVVTDVELTEMRYSGPEAAALRGFKAIYFSVIINTIIKAQVVLAMAKVMEVFFGSGRLEAVIISSAITVAYTAMSGYWGVILTDFFQFILAMAGAVILAVVAVGAAGGVGNLETALSTAYPGSSYTSFFPPLEGGLMGPAALTFISYMGFIWWARYSSDGNGVVVQRMASCKDERHAVAGTLFFNIMNYALRSWPWIIAALASLIIYPVAAGEDPEMIYPRMVAELLPSGVKGVMVASFFAAFMSTISVHLNLSSAYFINDFYRRFIRKDASERHYIAMARWAAVVLSLITAFVAYNATSILGIFKFLLAFGAGTGMVYILRWFWWRINAWSEISAMVASTAISTTLYVHPALKAMPYYEKLFTIISLSAAVWVVVTYLTPPTDARTLAEFYRKAAPGGPGWARIERSVAEPHARAKNFLGDVAHFVLGAVMIYGLTLGLGKLLLGHTAEGALYTGAAVVSGALLLAGLTKRGWRRVYE